MTGDSVWIRPADGGPDRQIISDRDLLIVSFPRFSPDGSRMIVAGVGHLERFVQKLSAGNKGDIAARDVIPPLAERITAVAAHGLPVDPWLVGVDGAGLQRLALLSIDDAAVAWSPDGRWVAVAGADGVRLLSPEDGRVVQVSEGSSFGAIDWR